MNIKPTSMLRRTLAGLGTALLLVGMAACAPGTANDGELKSEGNQLTPEQWRIDIDDCMTKAGFDMGSGDSSEPLNLSNVDMDEFDKAYGGCIDEIGDIPIDPNMPTEDEIFESQLKFAACMREAGYDHPDPVKGDGGLSGAFGPETDYEVVEKCSELAYGTEVAK